MPTNRKRRTRGQGGLLDQFQIEELETGKWCLLAATGYQYADSGLGDAPGLPAMKRDWKIHGEGITADWIKRHPGSRPWAWWRWDAPEPKADSELEREYLARHGLLTDWEREQ